MESNGEDSDSCEIFGTVSDEDALKMKIKITPKDFSR